MLKLYKVVEVNVDGCGSDADEYISSRIALEKTHLKAFNEILHQLKNDPEWEDTDTSAYVEEACRLFNERFPNYNLGLTFSPFEDVIEF